MAKKFTVITLNTWVDNHRHQERTEEITKYIDTVEPDVVFLQECFSSLRKQIIRDDLNEKYHIIFTNRQSPYVPWVGYLPFAVVFGTCSSLLLLFATTGGSSSSVLFIFNLSGVVGSLLLFPRILCIVAKLVVYGMLKILHKHKATDSDIPLTDWMALAILVRRKTFRSANLILSKPFTNKAYPLPSDVSSTLEYFIMQIPLLCPGFLAVSCVSYEEEKEVVLVNVHAVVGVANRNRVLQLQELHQNIKSFSEVIVAGDFNASTDQPEMDYFRMLGYSDVVQTYKQQEGKKSDGGDENCWNTWDNENRFVKAQNDNEPDAQIDYIFQKGVHYQLKHVKLIFDGSEKNSDIVSDHYGLLATS